MRRNVALVLALVFLSASWGNFAKPALSSDESSESPWVPKEPLPKAGAYFKAAVANDNVYVIDSNFTYKYDSIRGQQRSQCPPTGAISH